MRGSFTSRGTGVTVELAKEEIGTVFRITKKGSQPVILWRTALENCHSLALSPDDKLVAFICELNGLLVATIEPRGTTPYAVALTFVASMCELD
jgi:hypothetical protein